MERDRLIPDDLRKAISFLVEVDRLKLVTRRSRVIGNSRQENSAEHSWHVALMALVLAGFARQTDLDLLRVIAMLLIHDIVEIDAGDTFLYDADGNSDKAVREARAAERIFALLPNALAHRLRALWDEFETAETAEARFAASVDRLQPLLVNGANRGVAVEGHVPSEQEMIARNRHIDEGAPALWAFARELLDEAISHGYVL